MSDGIRWIGEHRYERPNVHAPGMLGSISLTAARGIGTQAFLTGLGADPRQLDEGHVYKDRRTVPLPDGPAFERVNHTMYGTCGDWVYLLEDWEMATYFRYRYSEPPASLVGAEIVCLSLNRIDPPSCIAHTGPRGHTAGGEFGEDTGCGSALDAALHAAGAVFPSEADTPEDEVELYWEQHLEELPTAVFSAVEAYCGLSVDRAAVEAGDLPVAVLPAVT